MHKVRVPFWFIGTIAGRALPKRGCRGWFSVRLPRGHPDAILRRRPAPVRTAPAAARWCRSPPGWIRAFRLAWPPLCACPGPACRWCRPAVAGTASGCRHGKMTASCPSGAVAAGRVKPRRRTGCPALNRARPPPGRPATHAGGRPAADAVRGRSAAAGRPNGQRQRRISRDAGPSAG